MAGFGCVGQRKPHTFTSDLPRIDANCFAKAGALAIGAETKWQWQQGVTFAPLAVLARAELTALVIRIEGQSGEVRIEIEKQPRHFGGRSQYYFRCPLCGWRRSHLYIGAGRIACRTCFGLTHASRHALTPAITHARRLRGLLGAAPGLLAPLPARPAHNMQAAKYDRVVAKLLAVENALAAQFGATVASLKRRAKREQRHGSRRRSRRSHPT